MVVQSNEPLVLRNKSKKNLERIAYACPSGYVTRQKLNDLKESGAITAVPQWLTSRYKVSRGEYRVPIELLNDGVSADGATDDSSNSDEESSTEPEEKEQTFESVSVVANENSNYVPQKNGNYISWGEASNVRSVLESGSFLPVFVTGLSGNGKTFMIEQEAAKAGRELFRVNITSATDESDLLGAFGLVDGNTVWNDGPIVEAMKRGAILLLDELDLGTEKIMCLQSVLEGKGVFIKKTNRWVEPADGFMVIATGNTKGQGDDTDKFIGTNILNEAFLERFPVWFNQSYPTPGIEKRIIKRLVKNENIDLDKSTIESLVKFANKTRDAFDEQACDDLITTRRLCLIVQLSKIYDSIEKAVEIACNRFCDETKKSFVDLFKSVRVVPDESNDNEPNHDSQPHSEWQDLTF